MLVAQSEWWVYNKTLTFVLYGLPWGSGPSPGLPPGLSHLPAPRSSSFPAPVWASPCTLFRPDHVQGSHLQGYHPTHPSSTSASAEPFQMVISQLVGQAPALTVPCHPFRELRPEVQGGRGGRRRCAGNTGVQAAGGRGEEGEPWQVMPP